MTECELLNEIKSLNLDIIKLVYNTNYQLFYKLDECPFCKRKCPNSNSLMSHLRYHKEYCELVGLRTRKGFENVYKNGRTAWNKGLTKETDERVKINFESLILTHQRKFGGSAWHYWKRTEYNNDKINYPEYYLSDEDIFNHNNLIYENYKSNYHKMLKFESGRMRGWHSYPEELLGDILFLLNIHYEREFNVYKDGYVKYRVDYYVPEFNHLLECDGDWKYKIDSNGNKILGEYYQNRSKEIELLTGKSVININSNSVIYYSYNKRELYELIRKPKYELITLGNKVAQLLS